jgi:hypothetical protein
MMPACAGILSGIIFPYCFVGQEQLCQFQRLLTDFRHSYRLKQDAFQQGTYGQEPVRCFSLGIHNCSRGSSINAQFVGMGPNGSALQQALYQRGIPFARI